MKKVFLFAHALCTLVFFTACNDSAEAGTHTHDDGSTHSDHAADTAKPQQQEFTVGDSIMVDTTVKEEVHNHKDGETHSH
jgi:hypothetical protein